MHTIRRDFNVYNVAVVPRDDNVPSCMIAHNPNGCVLIGTASELFGLEFHDDRMMMPDEHCVLVTTDNGNAVAFTIRDLLPVIHEYNRGM